MPDFFTKAAAHMRFAQAYATAATEPAGWIPNLTRSSIDTAGVGQLASMIDITAIRDPAKPSQQRFSVLSQTFRVRQYSSSHNNRPTLVDSGGKKRPVTE
jgi:hypothetical protein